MKNDEQIQKNKNTGFFEVFLGFIGIITILFCIYFIVFHYIFGIDLLKVDRGILYRLKVINVDETVLKNTEDASVLEDRNTSNKIIETQPDLNVNIYTKEDPDISKIESPKPVSEKTEAVPNNPPVVEMLYYNLSPEYSQGEIEQFNLYNSDDLPLYAQASDSDGYIKKVEIYVDNSKATDIYPYEIGGMGAEYSNSKTLSQITDDIKEWLTDKTGEKVLNTPIYYSRDWNDSLGCGVPRGYAHIIITEKNVYDIRTPRDLEFYKTCYSGKTINYGNVYVYVWNDVKKGEHSVYAIAYDDKNFSTISDIIKIKSRE